MSFLPSKEQSNVHKVSHGKTLRDYIEHSQQLKQLQRHGISSGSAGLAPVEHVHPSASPPQAESTVLKDTIDALLEEVQRLEGELAAARARETALVEEKVRMAERMASLAERLMDRVEKDLPSTSVRGIVRTA